MAVVVSKEARRDLEGIRRYILEELANPEAARRIMTRLKQGVLSLEALPWRGKPLDAMISVHTEYRCLICESYCIFYVIDGENVMIVRILHQRQDCVRALLTGK